MVRFRWLVVATVVVVSAVAGYFASKIHFANDLQIWFQQHDPYLVRYKAFLERFESDRIIVVGVFGDDIFKAETLAAIDRVTRRAEELDSVHRVRSLTNARVFKGEEDSVLIAPLVRRLPRTPAESRAVRDWALANPLLRDILVTADGTGAAVVVELDPELQQGGRMLSLVDRLHEIVRAESGGKHRVAIAGEPVFEAAFNDAALKDMLWLVPMTAVLVIVVVWVVFRRFVSALLPYLLVLVAFLWTFGSMGVVGAPLTVVSSPLMGLIVAVGVCNGIHVLAEYYRRRGLGADHESAVVGSAAHLMVPCSVASVTTILSLLSLSISSLRPIQEFSVFSSLGILFAYVLGFTLLPALMAIISPPPRQATRPGGPVVRALEWMGGMTPRRARWVVLTSAVLLAAGFFGITRVTVGPIGIGVLRKDHPVRIDNERIDRDLGGADALEIMVQTGRDGLKDPALLRRIDALQRWVERFPAVSSARSVVDSLKELNRVLHEGEDAAYRLPETHNAVAQYFLLYEGEEDFRKLVQKEYSLGRISVRVRRPETATAHSEMLRAVEARSRAMSKEGLKVRATGSFALFTRAMDYMVESMVESFLLAFLVTSIVITILFRSVRLGLFAMIPNLLPIVVGLGAMPALGITLNPGTLMIGSVAIGLVVDDTVHFMFRFRAHVTGGVPLEQSLSASMHETGRPIVATSAALIAGFVVWTLAAFVPAVDYGIITSLIILFALTADLILLPAMLVLVRPRLGPARALRSP